MQLDMLYLIAHDQNTIGFRKFLARNPRSDFLKVFVCVAYSKNPDVREKLNFDPENTKFLFIGYSDNTAYYLQIIKTRQIFTSRNVSFNDNNLPGFPYESKYLIESFLYLDLDEVREEVQGTSNSSESRSHVEKNETKSVQESEMHTKTEFDREIKDKRSSLSVKPNLKSIVQFYPKVAVKTLKKMSSKILLPIEKLQQKKEKLPSILQMKRPSSNCL